MYILIYFFLNFAHVFLICISEYSVQYIVSLEMTWIFIFLILELQHFTVTTSNYLQYMLDEFRNWDKHDLVWDQDYSVTVRPLFKGPGIKVEQW